MKVLNLSLSLSCSLSRAALLFWEWAISLVRVSLRYISPEHFLSSSCPLSHRSSDLSSPQHTSKHVKQHKRHITGNSFSELGDIMHLISVNQDKFSRNRVWHVLPVLLCFSFTPPACVLNSAVSYCVAQLSCNCIEVQWPLHHIYHYEAKF